MNTRQDNAQRKLHNRIFSKDFKRSKIMISNFVLHKLYYCSQMLS